MIDKIEVYRRTFEARQAERVRDYDDLRRRTLAVVKRVVRRAVKSYLTVARVYLLGSVTRAGDFRPDSDVDIAVEGVSAVEYWALWAALRDLLPDWPVDLRVLSGDASPIAHVIRRRGVKIYERAAKHATGANLADFAELRG